MFNIIPHESSDEKFAAIALVYFHVYIIGLSTKVPHYFESSYFEILAKVFSFQAALRQQALMRSLKVDWLNVMIPRAFTDFSDMTMVFSFNWDSIWIYWDSLSFRFCK